MNQIEDDTGFEPLRIQIPKSEEQSNDQFSSQFDQNDEFFRGQEELEAQLEEQEIKINRYKQNIIELKKINTNLQEMGIKEIEKSKNVAEAFLKNQSILEQKFETMMKENFDLKKRLHEAENKILEVKIEHAKQIQKSSPVKKTFRKISFEYNNGLSSVSQASDATPLNNSSTQILTSNNQSITEFNAETPPVK